MHVGLAAPSIPLTFVTPEGERIDVVAAEGDNILDLAHANNVELEGSFPTLCQKKWVSTLPLTDRTPCTSSWTPLLEGACEASLACSTCHVILEPEVYEKLPEPTDEENDMLDLAFGLTETCVC